VGVPYSLCRLSREHEWAVVEMGMNHFGEISHLSKLAQPDHVAITTVAPAHIECLGSLAGIAQAKFEIVQGLRPGGSVILRDDSSVIQDELARVDPRGALKVQRFGAEQGSTLRIVNLKSLGLEGVSFELERMREGAVERAAVRMSTLGTQNAYNAACAVLAACALVPSMSLEFAAKRLASFVAPLMRMNLKHFGENISLIDDSYNANPASMGAFLDLASDLQASGLPVALVIGDMLELGSFSALYHDEIGKRVAALRPAALAAVGPEAGRYLSSESKAFPQAHCASADEAATWILQQRASHAGACVFMVKASRGIGLDKAVKHMEQELGNRYGQTEREPARETAVQVPSQSESKSKNPGGE
jgi:UDP-N-acetylmuramoyl-tripeptide--D-alanyl-D-alanine ligase